MKRLTTAALAFVLAGCSAAIPARVTAPAAPLAPESAGASVSVYDPASALRTPLDVLGGAPLLRTLTIALFDAPLSSADKVYIALDGIQLLTGGGAVPFSTNYRPQVVNLLDLQDASLQINGKAPLGVYTGIRFIINTAGSNLVTGGVTMPIVWGTPGHPVIGSIVAIDVPVSFAILANGKERVSLDFNVLQSVRFANGTAYVQPTVSGSAAAAEIHGNVANKAGKPVTGAAVVVTDVLGRVLNVTTTNARGAFTLHALPPGFCTVAVRNTFVSAGGETLTATGNDANASAAQGVVLSPNDDLDLGSLID